MKARSRWSLLILVLFSLVHGAFGVVQEGVPTPIISPLPSVDCSVCLLTPEQAAQELGLNVLAAGWRRPSLKIVPEGYRVAKVFIKNNTGAAMCLSTLDYLVVQGASIQVPGPCVQKWWPETKEFVPFLKLLYWWMAVPVVAMAYQGFKHFRKGTLHSNEFAHDFTTSAMVVALFEFARRRIARHKEMRDSVAAKFTSVAFDRAGVVVPAVDDERVIPAGGFFSDTILLFLDKTPVDVLMRDLPRWRITNIESVD